VEFVRSRAEIVARFGEGAPERLAYQGPALVSDDTQMTLFSAEAMIRARAVAATDVVPFALGAYQRWLATQELSPGGERRIPTRQGLLLADPRLHERRAPGNTCLSALVMSFSRTTLASVADPPNGSKGCGAVMRAAPFGLAASSREQAFQLARDTSVLTHGHPAGYLAAAHLAALVFDLVRGIALATALDAADALLALEPENEEVRERIAIARAAAGAHPRCPVERVGEGWIAEEALAVALLCALDSGDGDLAGALWRAAAHGGDSDSTASIAGQLLGAARGRAALPARWLAELELADLIERVAGDLHAVCVEGRAPSERDYPRADGRFVPPR
jgi:ADP-ribosylglycohydrolase